MKTLRCVLILGLGLAPGHAAEAWLDRVEEALTFSGADARIRGRLSGTLELEGYASQLPPPGVVDSASERLFVPRLSTFLDVQVGSRLYLFAQVRADRGFDPRPAGAEVRLDEYALRLAALRNRRLHLQVGKFATVVGNWATRHGAWANPFITAPLPYEHLTGIWDTEAIRNSNTLLQWSHLRPGLPRSVTAIEKTLRVPIVWGPSYATGVAVSGDAGRWRLAAEVKAGSLSSRPEAWHHAREQRHHPTVSGRLGFRPNPMWDLGLSASAGSYLREGAGRVLAPTHGRGDYRQVVLAHDLAFAWHHLQVWAEVYASRFEIPTVGDAETLAYYAEAKYKLGPQWSAALRWGEQWFGRIPSRLGPTRWGANVWRVEAGPGYRLSPHAQLKFQYTLQHGDSGRRDTTRLLATQLTVRF